MSDEVGFGGHECGLSGLLPTSPPVSKWASNGRQVGQEDRLTSGAKYCSIVYRRYALGREGLEPSLRSPRSGFTVPRLLFADVHAGPWTRTRRLCRADAVRHARLWSSRLVSPLVSASSAAQ